MEKEKLKVVAAKAMYADDLVQKSMLMIHAWTNGEGFELNLARKGNYQTISMCYSEFDLLKKMVKKLEKTPLSA